MNTKPMLLSNYHNGAIKENTVYIQEKLNGFRAIIDTKTGTIYSRNGKVIDLPHISAEIMNNHNLPDYIDGELTAPANIEYKKTFFFNAKNHMDYCEKVLAVVQSKIRNKSEDVIFNCFDVISDGTFSDRLKKVNAIKETYHVKIVRTSTTMKLMINSYYNSLVKSHYHAEGIVIRTDSTYYNGRSNKIFKMKPIYD